jgi:hypothetical protein
MCFRRLRVGALAIVAVALMLAAAPAPGGAASLDACAQRVIRDWYKGGRVDDVYPLACYRAALRSLPDDVLQYSNADQDIRRALAFARRGKGDPGNRVASETPASEAPSRPATSAAKQIPAPVANEAASPVSKAPVVAETQSSAMPVPYPILVLAGLAGVLLVAGGVGWLAGRGR